MGRLQTSACRGWRCLTRVPFLTCDMRVALAAEHPNQAPPALNGRKPVSSRHAQVDMTHLSPGSHGPGRTHAGA
jgi:hypothetical protein